MRSERGDLEEVLDRARGGDERAWATLYDSLAPQLNGYLRVKGAHDPDSLMGDVFLHVVRGIDGFEGTAAGFRSWVFVIASSRLLDERRRLRRKPTEPLEATVSEQLCSAADVEAEVERIHAATAARRLLCCLTPDQRSVVELRVFGGLTSPEVSAIVDKPVGAVKALYRRALATLRRELDVIIEIDDRTAELVGAGGGGVPQSLLSAVTQGR